MVAIAAFLAAILSGMGVGSGGLFALWLKYFTELSQMPLQGTNLIFFLASALGGAVLHLQRRRIYPAAVALCLGFGAFGTWLGSRAAFLLEGASAGITGRLLGALMIATGLLTLLSHIQKRRKAGRVGRDEPPRKKKDKNCDGTDRM